MNMNKRSSLTASDFTMKKMLLRYLVIYALTGLYACDMPDKDLDGEKGEKTNLITIIIP